MSNSVVETIYTTVVNGKMIRETNRAQLAFAAWTQESHALAYAGVRPTGGVQVQSLNSEGVMVRDGWLMHVAENGHVYINSTVTGMTVC